MEISVRQTNLQPNLIKILLSNGIVLVSHLNTFDVLRLSKKTRLSQADCEKILAATKPKRPHYIIKLSELMLKPFERLSTLIGELDRILEGGIRCGHITEISGEAGSGKSNLCAEIGTLVMLPNRIGGRDGQVLLIHTEGEGKLKLEIKRFNTLSTSVDGDNHITDRLRVMNCANEFELAEIINRLSDILDEQPAVKLIIIDSITCAFISIDRDPDFEFYAKRSLRLTQIVKTLTKLAWERRVAVIATNHVSYNPKFGQNMPALGKIWSHLCQTKISLEKRQTINGVKRFAHVTKGAMRSPEPVPFEITNNLFD